MTTRFRNVLVALAAIGLTAAPCAAQQQAGLMGDLLRDVEQVRTKLVALAGVMPADKQGWRPGDGVRSVGEVFLHVAADNYLLPAAVGVPPDASTRIDPADFSTVTRYERQQMPPDSVVATLERSFEHLARAMAATPEARLQDTVKFFGQDMTVRQVWLATAMHLHEHLGQMIAYARTNGIVPPWSRQGG